MDVKNLVLQADGLSQRDVLPSTDPGFDALLADWRQEGRQLVADHWAEFEVLLDTVESLIVRGRLTQALAAAQIAANHAVFWHPGCFVSPRLERLVYRLGVLALPAPARQGSHRGGLRILHVASQLKTIGGHARMMWRWIARDNGNVHSVMLTRQTREVPVPLTAAVRACGGTIRAANRAAGGPLAWARCLQEAIAASDLVVLHVDNQDIIPFLALAGLSRRPPVLMTNHADHVFWLGSGFVDMVVNTRRSGHALCAARRGIAPERNALLPLSLESAEPSPSRSDAKRALGLDADSIVLLTIARSVKYRPLGGLSYADAFVPLLLANPKLHLVAVGPGGTADWSQAERAVPGRIHAHAERSDTGTFFAAADVFVDSFPFSSITSLLEAGLHGLPLVTRNPFGPGCEIMGADSLGIDEVMLRSRDIDSFRDQLGGLVEDAALRARLGRQTAETIRATNMGEGWMQALTALYDTALQSAPVDGPPEIAEAPRFDDLDLFSPFVFGKVLPSPSPELRLAHARELGLKTMPVLSRLRAWTEMRRNDGFVFRSGRESYRYLVPEWLTVRLRGIGS